ncbi:hypothetical protein ACFYYY_15210 [Streptomyces sp. NPDC001834]|uniref:hypothetical protein n=1 Tax=Streptomyces sp. NPDC001834 TaxID=3364616 RepID=UPI00368E73EF
MSRDDEPVFIRSMWGTSRYVYNYQNPVGRALIVIALLVTAVMTVLMAKRAGPFAPPEPMPTSTEPAYAPWSDSLYTPEPGATPGAEDSDAP